MMIEIIGIITVNIAPDVHKKYIMSNVMVG